MIIDLEKPVYSGASEKHGVHYYKKQIRSSMLLFMKTESLFLFDFAGNLYITKPEGPSIYYRFIKDSPTPFFKTDEFDGSWNFEEALMETYYSRLDSDESMEPAEYFDSYDGIEEMDLTLPKKQRRFIQLVLAIENGLGVGELEDIMRNPIEQEMMALDLIEELANEFLFSSDEMTSVLNRVSGEIMMDAPESLTGEPEIDWDDEEAENLIEIPQITTAEAFDIRLLFAKQQKPDAKDSLLDALHGNKPFKNFRILVEKLNLDQSWYDFEFQYAKDRMKEWVNKWKL